MAEAADEEQAGTAPEVLAQYRSALEEFFAGGLHGVLMGFVSANQHRFARPDPQSPDEHSHANYELFQEFGSLVEAELGRLLSSRGLSSEALWAVVQELHGSGEGDLQQHCSFLLSSTDYSSFLALFAVRPHPTPPHRCRYTELRDLEQDYQGMAAAGGSDELGGALEEGAVEGEGEEPEWA